jgi:hypothetical protein
LIRRLSGSRETAAQRALTDDDLRKQRRRQEADAAREVELDQWDAMMAEAHSVTFEADMLAHRLAYGLATLDEARQFISDTDTSANPYIDLAYLEHTCLMVEIAQATSVAR